jgi:cell division transport system ATP-binding protein
MIELHNVFFSYSGSSFAALSDVNLKIDKGEFVFLTGISGAGKSTLLKLLYGVLQPTKGQVVVDSQNISALSKRQIPFLRRKTGVVFQDFKLLPNRTVLENVSLTLEVLGWKKKDVAAKAYRILKQVGIESRMNSFPLRLSGGEQQRVALARALVNDPKIVLADEPTGNLDEESKELTISILKEANLRGSTIVVATHDRRLISCCNARTVTLEKGQITEDAGKND